MADIRELRLNLTARSEQLTSALNDSQLAVNKFGKKLDAIGRKATLVLGGLAVAGYGAVKSAEDVAVANARLATVLQDMGFAQATDRVTKYAEALEMTTGVDAEVIKLTQAKLATFKNLTATVGQTGGAFDRATKAALDMAAAGFGEASSNAVQLGKALQDPIKGITALSRSGITFNETQKAMIAQMVKSGDMLGAQNMILGAVEEQVGGTAAATVTATQKMSIAFNNVAESIGTILLPFVQKLSDAIVKMTPWLQENANALVIVAGAVGGLAIAVKTLQFALDAVSVAIKVATGLQWLFNVALNANPIGLMVAGLAALVVGIKLAYDHFKPFADLVDRVVSGVKSLGGKAAALVGNFLGGGKATGGTVRSGGIYRVGEFGPETLVMGGASGSIRPDSSASGNVTININGIVDAESARRSIEQLLQNSARRTGAVSLVGATL